MTAASLQTAATTPLWWDDVAFGTQEPLAADLAVDVAIVGAG